MSEKFKKPNIAKFIQFICEQYNLDPVEVRSRVVHQFPELKNKEKCANCNASMAQYVYTLDVLDTLLVFGMGKIVSDRCKKGIAFTEANKIHITTLLNNYYSVVSRQSQTSKLGLIAKVRTKDGKHDVKAGWLITRRGFEFLSGKPVPSAVQVFRNEITEHFEEMTTFAEVMKQGEHRVEGSEINHYKDYNFMQLETWAIAGFAQGKLL